MKKLITLSAFLFGSIVVNAQTQSQKDYINNLYIKIIKNPSQNNSALIDDIVKNTVKITELSPKYEFLNLDLYRLHFSVTTKFVPSVEYSLVLRNMIQQGWVHIETKESEVPAIYAVTFTKVREGK
jgi:hypothetical protein